MGIRAAGVLGLDLEGFKIFNIWSSAEPKVEVKGITRKGHNTHTHLYTPWKINMEPTNHPFRKENDLPNLHDYGPCSSSRVYTANATHLFTRS